MAARRIVLCADDYAMTPGVSDGIRALAAAGRISATGAMTNSESWPAEAAALRASAARLGTGLHLTLTWGRPLGAMPSFAPDGTLPSLGRVIRLALSGRLPGDEVEAEITRQLDAFGRAMGREPDFVDGHQHVHALPGVRTALFRALARRSGRPWIRDPADTMPAILGRRREAGKALLVRALSAGFGSACRGRGFATNHGFSGFSNFAPDADLARDFPVFLERLGPSPLVMCHPGRIGDGRGLDGVVEARERELDYLASPEFGALLERRGIELVPAPAP